MTNRLLLDNRVVEHSKTDWRVDKIQVSVDAVGEEFNKIKNFDSKNKERRCITALSENKKHLSQKGGI